MDNKKIKARVNRLVMMDNHIRQHIDNEELIVNDWLANAVPDCYDREILEFIANDDESYIECLKSFARCCINDMVDDESEEE